MEAAAIGATKSALNSVVKTTTTAITDEIGLLLGVQEELFFIKEELEMMQGFLQVAKTDKVKGVVVSIWVKQVQELAFDVEDCLQEASVNLMKKSCLPIMFSVKKRDDIARKIRVLKARIEDVSKRNQRYNLINMDNTGQTYNESASTRSIAHVKALLVGLDEPKKALVKLIEKDHAELQEEPWKGKVISVVGMGGLGKTTLVREVYGCQELRDKFMYFAWVTIQHPFHKDEFIESLTKQIPFDAKKRLLKIPIEEKAKNYLKDKKYLIVLDDMSSESEWVKIKNVLPVVNGSRIIVTTRNRKPLAESISHPSDNIYEIKKLSREDAFDLFCKEVYKTSNYRLVSEEGTSSTEKIEEDSKVQKHCVTNTITEEEDKKMKDDLTHESKCKMKNVSSSNEITEEESSQVHKPCNINIIIEEEYGEMKDDLSHESKCKMKNGSSSTEITKEDSKVQEQSITITFTKDMDIKARLIIESCGRLPLAIVTIGSYLATKPKTSAEWMKMHEELSSEITNNPDLGVVKAVLTSSYDGLPYHLKPCLLYLSAFHNHKEIRRSRIIRRWMADGYVMADRKKKAEDVGKGYFNDLTGRSLIQPSQMSTIINGDIKSCNIHDLMYELILAKAEDENMVSKLEDENLITMTDKVRHLVIAGGSCKGDKVLERVKLSHMRSLSIFGQVGDYLKYSRMKLVRVLDLEGTINLKDRDLRSIGKLRYLKYLGLRGTKIRALPNSLGKLSELETLDIRDTGVVQLPTGLTKLHKLSYLCAGFGEFWWVGCGVRVPQGIGKLRSLNTFGIIDIGGSKSLAKKDIGGSESLAEELQNLTNLRKLAVTNFTEENGKTLGKVIDGLKHLRSLVLGELKNLGLRCCLESVSSPPMYLQSLKLHGPLGKLPDWISSLENLKKIHLRETKLTGGIEAEGIEAIEKLPNLKILHMLRSSFGRNVLCFGEGTFPMLQVMILEGLKGLESVVIEKTALKRLEQLKIRSCWEMKEDGVLGLEFLEQLKEMEVVQGLSFDIWDKSADDNAEMQQRNNTFVSNLQVKLSMHPTKPVLRVIKEEHVWYY